MHLAALSRSIPKYHRYLLYKVFAGTKYKAKNTFIKKWFERYIEPTDGANNGYAFCLSDAHGEINLSKVISKAKVKTNELKTRLEAMSSAIRKEERKVEVDAAQDPLTKTN